MSSRSSAFPEIIPSVARRQNAYVGALERNFLMEPPQKPVGHGVAGRPRVEVCGANQCPQCDRVVVHERQLYANTRYGMMYVFPELCLPRDHSFCGPPPERVRGSTGAQLPDGAPLEPVGHGVAGRPRVEVCGAN
jgi:hypothetical protein